MYFDTSTRNIIIGYGNVLVLQLGKKKKEADGIHVHFINMPGRES